MQKIRFFLILILLPFSLLAQQKTKILLISSSAGTVTKTASGPVSYLRNPVFKQDNATLACDSAVFYEAKNMFDAYNRVHINQADTINIYSDKLNYDGNTKNAHLTGNVKLIDKDNVLTTNILDYNLGSKVGTYVTGGKIVNKDVTLTSKNGYYFSNSRDAYFRYDVVVVTPESTIKSDTLRYNTLTNWTYFYGPTNIKGKDDNLYTENGAYNTKTQYAYFGKKNLYTQASKSLKGDSLYYDGIAGYGKAVRNIVFKDTTDKTVMYGQLAYYYKIDQRTIVTKNPYIGMGTSDSVMVGKKLQPDSLWMGADTLETQMVLLKTLKLISSPVLKKDNEMGEDEKEEPKVGDKKAIATTGQDPKKAKKGDKNTTTPKTGEKPVAITDSTKIKIPGATDSLKKDSIPIKKDNIPIKKKEVPINKKTIKKGVTDSTILTVLQAAEVIQPTVPKDSVKIAKADPKKPKSTDAKKGDAKKGTDPKKGAGGKTPVTKPGVKPAVKDTLPFNPADTIRTRAIRAYHHVRVFKSNMQARADSLFYTSSDSTLRWYGSPILWAEGSQQTGDTIYLKLKNKQLNTSQVLSSGFMVNVNADSARFNQIKGKLITGFFIDGKLNRMFVDGNAESIYFNKEKDSIYTEMNQTVSARIKILFKDKEIKDIITIKDTEGARTPIKELKEDVFLTGFIWKPELRPLSKKEVINGKPKPKPGAKKGPGPKGPKLPVKKDTDDPKGLPKDTLGKETGKATTLKPTTVKSGTINPGTAKSGTAKQDSVSAAPLKTDSAKTTPVKTIPVKTDTTKTLKIKADTTKGLPLKTDPVKAPVVVPLKKQ
ncbi:OstA-like protein [Pedobacter caeni]|uniref:OstA-like protein n=1 Tax=Pedobacter caeni TaxID=288992 RepID=A0A1M5DW66_9SPHI|nr:OstA-like protein [Pedobacter caeni]